MNNVKMSFVSLPLQLQLKWITDTFGFLMNRMFLQYTDIAVGGMFCV